MGAWMDLARQAVAHLAEIRRLLAKIAGEEADRG